ncbi:MAG: NAD-dependent protein deacylase [Bacilli bacterium]|nr:NAD-dependent protein deacylase [Bacilli bacterium]
MINKLEKIINESDNIVFFGGAGVSTESGIPDFRSQDGLYNLKYDYPPEEILSDFFFYNKPREFYKFYFDKLVNLDIKPNYTHIFLKKLEDMNKLKAIVTQNIDGLHEMAGSKKVYTIHGNVNTYHCIVCGKEYKLSAIMKMKELPICECGNLIKPDVVLYGEALPNDVFEGAIKAISEADTLIVGGTSLTVFPASSLINYFHGKHLIIINRDHLNVNCELQINDSIGETFKKINLR